MWDNVHPPPRVTCQVSKVRCRESGVTCQTCKFIYINSFFLRQNGRASWWRLCYRWIISHIVYSTQTKMTYLSQLPQIRKSKKCTIASKQIHWPCLLEITGLLADSARMTSYDLRSRKGLSAILCLASIGLKWKLQKSVPLQSPIEMTCKNN